MPFQLLYGRLPNLPGILRREPKNACYAYDSYVNELEANLQSCYIVVRRNLETAKFNKKGNYGREVHVPKFEVGSIVLVRDESVRRGRSKNQHM
jgi:hypothetical protein